MKRVAMAVLAVLMSFLASYELVAQTPASVFWSCAPPDSQNVSATGGNLTGLPQIGSPGFVVRDYSNGPGPDQRWWPFAEGAAVSWGNETGQIDTRWIQYAAYPDPNFTFRADSLTIYLGAKGTNAIRANIWYATNAAFSNPIAVTDSALWLIKDSDQYYNFALNADVDAGDTLFVRICPWYIGSPSTSKYLYVRQATLHGVTKALTYPATATWELTNPADSGTGLAVATAGQVVAAVEWLNNIEINQYTGPESSQRLRIAGNAWPALQMTQIDTVFVQFAVSPKAGYNLQVTSVSLGIACAGINTMKATIYYSTDPTFNIATPVEFTTPDTTGNNYLPRDLLTPVTAAPNTRVNSGQTFYLRVYPWVHNDPAVRTGKYVCLKNVIIRGEIEGQPTPAFVVWPFEADDHAVTTGPIIAEKQGYSQSMKFYNLTNLETINGKTVSCGTIQTVSKTWHAEPIPADSLWFQYAVAPKHGGTFYINSVSMYLGGWYTNNLKAEIYYSNDLTFKTKTLLIADTSLAGNKVMPLTASLNETVLSGETFYLRVYPHNTQAEGWAKLVAVDSVVIAGSTSGVTADPPTVTTAPVTDISTTFATSGGNIPTDGGDAVIARGVCWNESGAPTIADRKTEDGTGSGSFISQLTGLAAGMTYYLRAFAANSAGAGYGEELTFTTLDSLLVPTVTTAPVSQIMVKTASCGGEVLNWGGDSVSVRGVCWNTSGNPTVSDAKTENGCGLGTFTSILYPLTENTTYYVRAYAANSRGTGYGAVDTFTTQIPAPAVLKVVARDGSGDYTSVQAAFNDIPDFYTGPYTIFVKSGIYYDKLLLDRNKTNVILRGENADSTILTCDDYAGKAGGTSMSYSVAIDADDFVAMNITFQNTVKNDGTFRDQQGVALRVNGDRQAYYNCKLLGYQDTFYTWGGRGTGRIYLSHCFIEGSVDLIFGRDIVAFDSCHIHINRDGGTLTAASTEANSKFGYAFLNCKITADSIGFDGKPITKFYLGRPWQAAPQTVFLKCEEPATLDPAGWLTWNVTPALYAEYACFGPGADFTNRHTISRQLTCTEADAYTLNQIFAKISNPIFGYDWLPEKPLVVTGVGFAPESEVIPVEYALSRNYPNPFNPTTTIAYSLPKKSKVKIMLYNMLGMQIITLVEAEQPAGRYQVQINAANLASGIYFYAIQAGEFKQSRKMLLLK